MPHMSSSPSCVVARGHVRACFFVGGLVVIATATQCDAIWFNSVLAVSFHHPRYENSTSVPSPRFSPLTALLHAARSTNTKSLAWVLK